MLSSYIAILTSDGIWNLLIKFSEDVSETVWIDVLTNSSSEIIITKIVLYIFSIVALWTKWTFKIEVPSSLWRIKKVLITLLFSFFSAALLISINPNLEYLILISTILVFVSWWSFLSESWINMASSSISNIYNTSYLAQLIVLNYNLIFVIPAISFVSLSLIYEIEEDLELD